MSKLAGKNATARFLLWGILLLYAAARSLQLYSGVVPTLTIVVLHVLPPAVFALLHGILTYRLRGILIFMGLCLGTGFFFESMSLRTGFPFGHYYFTDVMGPKLFQLPVLLVLAYVGMGYVSWVLGLVILGYTDRRISVRRVVTLPLITTFIMVAWDLSMEPFWSTIARAWVWKSGGPYFGVPIGNFMGWYLTVYVFYQLFALYLRKRDICPQEPSHWRLPVLFYAASACGNLLLAIPTATTIPIPTSVADASGKQWMVSDIIGTCVLVSLFVMGPLALMAWVRLSEQES